MAGNSFGQLFRITTFGESHGPAIGGVIDGCPAGLKIDFALVQKDLDRRRPGQSAITTTRSESDEPEFLSGIFDGVTTGAPIAFMIRNKDARPADYENMKEKYRPSHADYTYQQKYGIRDYRGGGRSSARETAVRVVAGAIARQILALSGITIQAFVKQVGMIGIDRNHDELDLGRTEDNMVRCPDPETAARMITYLEGLKKEGDSTGGIIQCVARNLPAGLGEPVFDKLHAVLAHAIMSINAVKGFEIGDGFSGATGLGSRQNDAFTSDGQAVVTSTNHSGGLLGGISNGMPVWFNVAFKPVATIMKEQKTVDTSGRETVLQAKGRHDPCVVPRAVPIVEAMTALVLVDFLMISKTSRT